MPRKKLIKTDEYFYHVTTRSNHREWFKLPIQDVWRISIKAMRVAQRNCPAIVSQYVLMSNHYHMLIRTPNSDIDRFMYFFNKTFSELLRKNSGYENRMFGGTYKWTLITTEKYFKTVFRYIYQNPVRAKIVRHPEEYKYSTCYFAHRNLKSPFPFSKITHLESRPDFLRTSLSAIEVDKARKGLKKSYYKERIKN